MHKAELRSVLLNCDPGQGLTREGHPWGPFCWRPLVRSSQSPDLYSLGLVLVWMMGLCIWEAGSRVSSPRQGHQRQQSQGLCTPPWLLTTRGLQMVRDMCLSWHGHIYWRLSMDWETASHLKMHNNRLGRGGSVQPRGWTVPVLCSGFWAATDGVEQGRCRRGQSQHGRG